MNNYNKKQG